MGGKFLFDFLKKKISGFIDNLTKKEEEKAEEAEKAPPKAERKPEPAKAEKAKPEPEKKHVPEKKAAEKKRAAPPEEKKPAPPPKKEAPPEPKKEPQPPPKKELPPPKEEAPKPAPRPKEEPPKAEIIAPPKRTGPEPEPPAGKIEPPPKKPERVPEAPKKTESAPPAPAKKIEVAPKKAEPVPEPPKRFEIFPKAKAPKPEPRPEPEPIVERKAKEPEPEPVVEKPKEAERPVEEAKEAEPVVKPPEPKIAPAPAPKPEKKEEKPKERIKLGIVGAVKSIITREVEIAEKDVREMADSLELELLEADVDMGVAESIKEEMMGRLVGSKVPKDKLHSFVSGAIKQTLVDILTNEKAFDILERVESSEKPVKIMFVGINGSGKTTTIAKVAHHLQAGGKKVVFAAADTFRAAAIEQMGVHADKLGVKMIKREYGSDPTSVAYDAVNYAKAHGADAVLIDTAGRQDTNISLLNEMKKMDRVIKPDIKIYIGESIAGNAMIEQVSAFNREVGIDAVILTKLDCDPKGGTMLSIGRATGVPIIYVGTGQGYDALERFDPAAIVDRIVG